MSQVSSSETPLKLTCEGSILSFLTARALVGTSVACLRGV